MKESIVERFVNRYSRWGYLVMSSDEEILESFQNDNTFKTQLFCPERNIAGIYTFQYIDGKFKKIGGVPL